MDGYCPDCGNPLTCLGHQVAANASVCCACFEALYCGGDDPDEVSMGSREHPIRYPTEEAVRAWRAKNAS